MSDSYDPTILHDLCRQASQESDSAKLIELVKKINELLDHKRATREEPGTKKSA